MIDKSEVCCCWSECFIFQNTERISIKFRFENLHYKYLNEICLSESVIRNTAK